MARITKAKAFCNDEVAYLAWETDGKIKGCLGFKASYANDENLAIIRGHRALAA